MIFLKKIVAILFCSVIAESLTVNVAKDFEGVRGYPVLKVSFVPKKTRTRVVKPRGEIRSNKLIISENLDENFSDELVDNVREFAPMSREDIKRMKKLSFHGRSAPKVRSHGTATRSISRHWPVHQVDYKQRKYNEQQLRNAEKNGAESKQVQTSAHPYQWINEGGFLPIIRPSPIIIHPVDEPSFETTRNHVKLLKQRQRQFFADFDETKAAEREPANEVEYFVKRERELADEQRPKLEHRALASAEEESEEGDDGRQYDSEEGEGEEESKQNEQFVPFRMLAQVRHVEAENHKPRSSAPEPRAKERLTLEKKNVYYKEEGYEEKDYDHGDEKVSSKFRVRRSVDNVEPSKLPVALAYVRKSKLPNLTGEALLRHLDEVLRNSSIFLPDVDDAVVITTRKRPSQTIYGTNEKNRKSHKYPYYNLPDSATLDAMSAFRYSENMKNFPREKQSLYSYKDVVHCEEIDQDVEPVPEDIDEKDSKTSYNKSPQRLNKLGDKIKCYKRKYFGKDPFDNPLFKEKYVAASVPIPFGDSTLISHQANPLITVYDDVISNIRAAFADELKAQREKALRDNAATEPSSAISASNTIINTAKPDVEVSNLSSSGAVARLSLFDINNYYPKFIVPLNKDHEDLVITTPAPLKNDYDTDIIELPIYPPINDFSYKTIQDSAQTIGETVITNLRPPNLAQEERPKRIQITRIYTPTHFFQPTLKEKYKFKLL